jgi:hypothetical protein
MFSDKHYVPAIKWKQGEFMALEDLRPHHKAELTPLVDVPSIPWDFAEERPTKTIDAHLARIPDQMAKAWGTERPLFLDMGLIDPGTRLGTGQHPLDGLFMALSAVGVRAIPVTATDRDPAYQSAVMTIVAREGFGLCVRAEADDFGDVASLGLLNALIDSFRIDRSEIDLIIDLGAINAAQSGLVARVVSAALTMIGGGTAFRTLTVLSGAFPVDMAAVGRGISTLPRSDWTMWLSLRSMPLARQPSFGDYTAAHPDPKEIDPRLMQASASIRYAADTDWVIAKGRSVNSPSFGGYGQFNTLAAALISNPLFTGASFSWSSDYITACAAGGPTGNLTTWRKVATNRHMSRTAHQIASLP